VPVYLVGWNGGYVHRNKPVHVKLTRKRLHGTLYIGVFSGFGFILVLVRQLEKNTDYDFTGIY